MAVKAAAASAQGVDERHRVGVATVDSAAAVASGRRLLRGGLLGGALRRRLLRRRPAAGPLLRAQAHLDHRATAPGLEVGLLLDEAGELLVPEGARVEVRVGAREVLADGSEGAPPVVPGRRVDRLGQGGLEID